MAFGALETPRQGNIGEWILANEGHVTIAAHGELAALIDSDVGRLAV
jgi:hypothetical protein